VNKFPAFYVTPKVHYRTHKCQSRVPILSQINPANGPHHISVRSILIHPTTPRSSKWSFSVRFPHQNIVFALNHWCIALLRVKLSPCTPIRHMEELRFTPLILNLRTNNWLDDFTLRPHYPRRTIYRLQINRRPFVSHRRIFCVCQELNHNPSVVQPIAYVRVRMRLAPLIRIWEDSGSSTAIALIALEWVWLSWKQLSAIWQCDVWQSVFRATAATALKLCYRAAACWLSFCTESTFTHTLPYITLHYIDRQSYFEFKYAKYRQNDSRILSMS